MLVPENGFLGSPKVILKNVFGYDEFRGVQEDIIKRLLGGGDALVIMPTAPLLMI